MGCHYDSARSVLHDTADSRIVIFGGDALFCVRHGALHGHTNFRKPKSQSIVYRSNYPVLGNTGKHLEGWEPIGDINAVKLLFREPFQRDESIKPNYYLEHDYTRVFSNLERTALKWTVNDVQSTLGGGRYTEHGAANIVGIEEIDDSLGSPRIYDVSYCYRPFLLSTCSGQRKPQQYHEGEGLFDTMF
ncbi:hypothetical protein EDC04DRAFT_1478638 [Pisolithus marmoratus]|nr:hypothetical protein EDC04DRAFT_1478638 [Pisolithus marmoratus]